jgi:hypothetical protein
MKNLILLLALNMVGRLAYGSNLYSDKVEQPLDSANKNGRIKKESLVIKGTWQGQMSGKSLTLVITEVNGKNLKGYNVLGTNRRNLTGTFVQAEWDQSCSAAFDAILKEPENDKWDGVFKIRFIAYEGQSEQDGSCDGKLKGKEASGTWSSNNGKLKKDFNLIKKDQ